MGRVTSIKAVFLFIVAGVIPESFAGKLGLVWVIVWVGVAWLSVGEVAVGGYPHTCHLPFTMGCVVIPPLVLGFLWGRDTPR